MMENISQQISLNNNLIYGLRRSVFDFFNTTLQNSHPNPLNKFGAKCFSQNDEDGIILEILRRINLLGSEGVFAEFGVGDGTENNTLILASLGWTGFWMGGEDLVFKHEDKTNFKYIKDWITLENIVNNSQLALDYLSLTASNIDVISLDLDGNDIYFVEELLKNKFKPKLFIVEYNAKFPPPVRFKIDYNSNHTWKGDDFFGASLTSFDDVFRANNYTLVCCNISGSNAFFIHDSLIHSFEDVPKEIRKLWVSPRYGLYSPNYGGKSIAVIENMFK